MLGKKGQESAPFELLVAIIIMAFVLIVGTQALERLAHEKCKGEIEAELESVKTAIEIVAKGQGKRNINIRFPVCFGSEDTVVKIIEREDPQLCAIFCGGSRSLCTTIVYSNPQHTQTKCLHISPATHFSTVAGECDAAEVNTAEVTYEALNFKGPDGIPDGRYILLSRLHATANYPIVCAFQEMGA